MIWLQKYIRWVCMSITISFALILYFYVQQTFQSSTLQTIRLTQVYGLTALLLLYLALLHTPLYAVFPYLPGRALWFKARRALGVSAWFYASLHASNAFFIQLAGFTGLAFLGTRYIFPILLSASALVMLTLMAFTSFDFAVRKLGKNWKRLHRLVYVAGILILLHALILGTHFQQVQNTIPVIIFSAILFLLILEGIRIDRYFQKQYSQAARYSIFFPIWCCVLIVLFGYLYLPSLNLSQVPSLNMHAQLSPNPTVIMTMPEMVMPKSKTTKRFSVSFNPETKITPNKTVNLRFRAYDAATGAPVLLFTKSFEKVAHLVIVDSSLNEFDHIHPEIQKEEFIVPYNFKKAGLYHLYLDFTPLGETEQQFAFTTSVGNYENATRPSDDTLPNIGQFGPFQISLIPTGKLSAKSISAGETTFKFSINNAETGEEVTDIQPYLGAFGHLVMIQRQTYEYIHVHPTITKTPLPSDHAGPMIEFKPMSLYGPITPGPYMLFAQFKHNDKIILAKFTVEISE